MKNTFILFLLLIATISKSQNLPYGKVWIGNRLEYFQIDTNVIRYQYELDYYDQKPYKMEGDTLILIDSYTVVTHSGDRKETQYAKALLQYNNDSLTLKPLDKAIERFGIDFRTATFYPLEKFRKIKQPFDSLAFHASGCYGSCPEMSFFINKTKVCFGGGRYAVKDGWYEAKITKQDYKKLEALINQSAIKLLPDKGPYASDAPVYHLDLYQGKEKKASEFTEVPFIARELFSFLNELPRKMKFIKKITP